MRQTVAVPVTVVPEALEMDPDRRGLFAVRHAVGECLGWASLSLRAE